MTSDLALVQRLEEANLSAWPSGTTEQDGGWLIRLTPDHPSRRINSFYALDPDDDGNLTRRIEAALCRFEAAGLQPYYRSTPLSPESLLNHLKNTGWQCLDETHVLIADLADILQRDRKDPVASVSVADHISDDWIADYLCCAELSADLQPALERILKRIPHPFKLIRMMDGETCLGTCALILDPDWAGLFEIAVHPGARGRGIGRQLVARALHEAKSAGRAHAWLQVVSDNHAAYRLYKAFGFTTCYAYAYWQPAASNAFVSYS